MKVLRHLLSILILPFTVVVAVPCSLASEWPGFVNAVTVSGGLLFSAGLALFGWCVVLFARVGRGTLAPWDPTRALVAVGPYRHVRNPMISGVAAMLFGEALFASSPALLAWAAGFVVVNHVYFWLVEEPGLERRFGAGYARYRAHVPRWIPRLRPWSDPTTEPAPASARPE